jgi:hypothetical protein
VKLQVKYRKGGKDNRNLPPKRYFYQNLADFTGKAVFSSI